MPCQVVNIKQKCHMCQAGCFNDQGAMQNGRGGREREEGHKVRVILTGSPCFL